jgi:hypothetical protein
MGVLKTARATINNRKRSVLLVAHCNSNMGADGLERERLFSTR